MNKFDLSKFLVENKLTQLGRLTEMGGDPMEKFLDDLHANVAPELVGGNQEQQLIQLLDDEGNQIFDEFGGESDGLDQATKYVLRKFGVHDEYHSPTVDMANDMVKKGMFEAEEVDSEIVEDYSKYNSVEELMKEIETSTNEAAMKHKMDRVKKAYESIEAKANSLEEGEHASFIAPAKIKEMRRSCKELRMMHEKLLKEYEKKYASKKKVDLNETLGENEGVKKPLADLTFADVVAAFPNIGQMSTTGFKTRVGVNFPNADDSANVVYREQDFENWKAGLISQVPDVTVELNPATNKVLVHGEDYTAKRDAFIASKQMSIDRMSKRR
jgi:hypothetical protein